MASVRARPLPPAASAYHLPGLRLLVGLCAELQRLAGDRPFFLGCRDAGRLLGVPFQRAAKWIRRLCADGILIRKTRGAKITGEASTYRYVADRANTPTSTSTEAILPPGDPGDGPYAGRF
jgi:hypothetical protein